MLGWLNECLDGMKKCMDQWIMDEYHTGTVDVCMDGWMDGCGTFLCWMVKLTGSVRFVLFTDARITVKTSEFISVLFSVWKYWWLRRLSIPFSVIKTTEAEPEQQGLMSDAWEYGRFCEGNAFLLSSASPLLALASACKFMSSVCPLAERATLLPSCSDSSSFSGLIVCRLKSWRGNK